jgi:predicted house-cleaning noncanonical NTP pyrophosphatase (MazG superfamily)
MSDTIPNILENINRLTIMSLSCTVEDRQKYSAAIGESVKEAKRAYEELAFSIEVKEAVTKAINELGG